MTLTVHKAELEPIQPLRALFLQETNFQIRYDACHERGWTDSYLLLSDDRAVGYASIKGRDLKDRDTVFEYFVVQPFRKHASEQFRQVFEHRAEPVGDFVVELQGEIVATGGFLTHYNPPFADLYMEVREDCRRRGIATVLLQEVKRE